MAKEKLKYSIQAVSKAVRYLRRDKKMSPLAFGLWLDKAPVVIDIVEQAHSEEGARLCQLLPVQEINDLVVCLEEVYGQPFDELCAVAEQMDEPEGVPDEITLHIPVTLSAEHVVDQLDQLLLMSSQTCEFERRRALRNGILTAGVMIQLLSACHLHCGRPAAGKACLARFCALLEHRTQCY